MWSALPDPRRDARPPEPLGQELDALMAHLGAPPARTVQLLGERWSDIVGADAAAHVRLGGLDHGTLLVEVDAPGWATKMRFGARDLLRSIEQQVGPEVATRVEVQVRPPTTPRPLSHRR